MWSYFTHKNWYARKLSMKLKTHFGKNQIMTSFNGQSSKKLNNGSYLFDVINTFAYIWKNVHHVDKIIKESFIIKIGCTNFNDWVALFYNFIPFWNQSNGIFCFKIRIFNGDSWLYSNRSCLQSWIIMINWLVATYWPKVVCSHMSFSLRRLWLLLWLMTIYWPKLFMVMCH